MEESMKYEEMPGSYLVLPGDSFPLTADQLRTYSPLSYAYIGDVVYELLIRTHVVTKGNTRPGRYPKKTTGYVNAAAQTMLMEAIEPMLSQEEYTIYHRGLNAKPATTAKNQTRHDYRIATGFETLIGWLYLSGRTGRIIELLEKGLDSCGSCFEALR